MAHRTDIVQVHQNYPDPGSGSQIGQVTDPVCGMKMSRKEARSVLYRGDEPIYFCSRTCRERYQSNQGRIDRAA